MPIDNLGMGGDDATKYTGPSYVAGQQSPFATLQNSPTILDPSVAPGAAKAGQHPTLKSSTHGNPGGDVIPDSLFAGGGGSPSWMGSQDDLFKQLMDEYGKVDQAFSTDAYDKASEDEYKNILSQGEVSSNAAAADYAARARQAGGSAEASGIIKAEGLVGARSQVTDFKQKQLQFDIQQKEAARELAAKISAQLGSLRMDYLKNLTDWNSSQAKIASDKWIAQFEGKNRIDVANIDAATRYAQINEQNKEFGWLHPQQLTRNWNYDPYYSLEHGGATNPEQYYNVKNW